MKYKLSFIYIGHLFKFRYDPVPGSGKLKNRVHNYFRHMKTAQERRWSYSYSKYIRAKRNATNLPNDWDDFPIADKQRGWKRTKKKRQWT